MSERRCYSSFSYLQVALALRCVKDGDDILAVGRGELADEVRKPGDQVLGFALGVGKVLSCDAFIAVLGGAAIAWAQPASRIAKIGILA